MPNGVNWDGRSKTDGASDAHYSHVEFRNEGGDDYRDNWVCQNSDVCYAGEATDSPIVLDWGEIGNYGADIEAGDYLQNRVWGF